MDLDPVLVVAGAGLAALGGWALLNRGGPRAPAGPLRSLPPEWGLERISRLQAAAAQASATDRVAAALDLGPRLTQAARSIAVEPGLSTRGVANRMATALAKHHLVPSLQGHNGFPAPVAVSLEPGVVHGLPCEERVLTEGALVTLEAAVCDGTGHAALTWTLPVGTSDPLRVALCAAATRALEAGIGVASPLARAGDLGAAMARSLRDSGFAPVLGYAGYTVGPRRIGPPRLSPLAGRGTGPRLFPGQLLFLLSLARQPTTRARTASDGWSVVTEDGSPTAAASALVLVTESRAERLTGPVGGVRPPGT